MHVCLPQRWQVYSRPDSSITASRAAPISGHPRRDRRYALVAAVDHRDGPEGPGGYPGLRFTGPHDRSPDALRPTCRPRRRPPRVGPARSPPALHRPNNLPVSPPRPPSSTGSRVGCSSWRTTPLRRRLFHLVKRFGGEPRSSPDPRASWAPSTHVALGGEVRIPPDSATHSASTRPCVPEHPAAIGAQRRIPGSSGAHLSERGDAWMISSSLPCSSLRALSFS
jgi:hypothetical protein